jgi:NADP-dependent alcohol dehydrogenase
LGFQRGIAGRLGYDHAALPFLILFRFYPLGTVVPREPQSHKRERRMENFTYHNPVKIVFGKGSIAELKRLVPKRARVLMTYGGGSIKRNGVYRQVMAALKGCSIVEFGGIEPNPVHETCLRAVALGRRSKADFLLAVGGGSVLDATKFIAAAMRWPKGDPWAILAKQAAVRSAVPLGCVLTLPATGSEMNCFAVISRASTQEKFPFASEHVYPRFAILDPETTFSLPPRQVANGIVDTFAHVFEQYMTCPSDAPLQDRQAEAILSTLIEEAPKVKAAPRDYRVRANLMWCATQALNGHVGVGVPQDWATHMIGHELTALYGIDHGRTLAVVLPGVLAAQVKAKRAKLAQVGRRVWGIRARTDAEAARSAIARTERFFESVGVPTRLSAYRIDAGEAAGKVRRRFAARGTVLGERRDLTPDRVAAIIRSRR